MKEFFKFLRRKVFSPRKFSSKDYWAKRYKSGGDSGPGSYGHLAKFKADTINRFVKREDISSVIEFGCGDGNQLALAQYPRYVGYDVSPTAIELCKRLFSGDTGKEFFTLQDYDNRQADLTLSLDVIFHLVEDDVFNAYMRRLFGASTRHVIIYSSNHDEPLEPASAHVRHREFAKWIERELGKNWTLRDQIPNPYPYNGDFRTTSFADFYIYERL